MATRSRVNWDGDGAVGNLEGSRGQAGSLRGGWDQGTSWVRREDWGGISEINSACRGDWGDQGG